MFATQFFLELISLQGSFDSFLDLSPHQVVTIEVQTRSQFSETDSVRVRLSEHISLVSRPAGGDLPAKYHRSPAQAWNQQFLELSSTLLPIFPTNPQCVWWHVSSNPSPLVDLYEMVLTIRLMALAAPITESWR